MTAFTGSNSERQSVGLPGHCDDCAESGHVDAHPDLGCSDVGCSSSHPEEPAPDTTADTTTAPVDPQAAAARALGHPWPLSTDEHPDLTKMRLREIDALVRGYRDGDVNHQVQPVIGWMRLMEAKGNRPTTADLANWIPRLFAACDAEDALLAERKASARATDGAPLVAVISHGPGHPETISSSDSIHGWDTAVPVYAWNTLRLATRRSTENDLLARMGGDPATAPTGWLYTPIGAHNLTDALAAMWTCPEAVALRDVPHNSGQYREPHLTAMEQSQFAMNRIWAEFLTTIGATA